MLDLAHCVQLRPFDLADAGVVEPWLCGPGLSLPGGRLRHLWPQRLLADRRIVASIGVAGGRCIGLVRLDCGPDHVAELTLVVAPECRRAGRGSEMFAAVMRQARRLGLRRLVVSIDLLNHAAVAFFHEQGFEHDGMVGNRLRMTRLVHAADTTRPLDVEA